MNNTAKYVGLGLVGGFILGIIFAPWLSFTRSGDRGAYSMMNQNIDRHFIEEMIPHHEGAIVMAELALQKATRPELKSLATAIITAQKSENEQMKAWYRDWFGSEPSNTSSMGGMMGHGGMGMQMMSMEGDLSTLKSAENFDLEFIDQMIPHHEMAIMMARMLAANTNRPEMKTLAGNIISSQSKEIEMMRQGRAVW